MVINQKKCTTIIDTFYDTKEEEVFFLCSSRENHAHLSRNLMTDNLEICTIIKLHGYNYIQYYGAAFTVIIAFRWF